MADDLFAKLLYIDGYDVATVGGNKSGPTLDAAGIWTMRYENVLTHDHALTRAKEPAHHAFVRLNAITHFSLGSGVILHIGHCAGFGDHGFSRSRLHLNNLHGISKNFVNNFVAAHR